MSSAKYDTIKSYLKDIALSLDSGQSMPSVRQLMRKFSVSQSPIVRVLKELREEGIIETRPGCRSVCTGHREICFCHGRETAENGTILSLFPDYPSVQLWMMERELSLSSMLHNVGHRRIRFAKDSNILEIVGRELEGDAELLGIIFYLPELENEQRQQLVALLTNFGKPVIFCDSFLDAKDFPSSCFSFLKTDLKQMSELVVSYYAARGISTLGYVQNEPRDNNQKKLRHDLRRDCLHRGMNFYSFSSNIHFWENSMESGREITRKNLRKIRELRINALLYTSMIGAIAGSTVLLKNGFRIPTDIHVAGGIDFPIAEYIYPPISAFVADYSGMCRVAMELIIGLRAYQKEIFFPHKLIERK